MKKCVIITLCLLFVLMFTACNENDKNNNQTGSNVTGGSLADTSSLLDSNIDATTQSSESADNASSFDESKDVLIVDSTENYLYEDYEDGIIISYIYPSTYDGAVKLIVPAEIDGKKVIGFGSLENYYNVFCERVGEYEVVIPDSVEFIGNGAFSLAYGLVKVSGGANCKSIGANAFEYCDNLKEITFINTVGNIGENAFVGCTSYNQ